MTELTTEATRNLMQEWAKCPWVWRKPSTSYTSETVEAWTWRRSERQPSWVDERLLIDWWMRKVTNNRMSGRKEVASGVPQGSMQAFKMFLSYGNEILEWRNSHINLFADDDIRRKIKADRGKLVKTCNTISKGFMNGERNGKWISTPKVKKK